MTSNDASVMFYNAISRPDPSFDRLANMMADFERTQVEAETHHEREKIEVEEHRVMLEAGTISLELYNTMKPKGF